MDICNRRDRVTKYTLYTTIGINIEYLTVGIIVQEVIYMMGFLFSMCLAMPINRAWIIAFVNMYNDK